MKRYDETRVASCARVGSCPSPKRGASLKRISRGHRFWIYTQICRVAGGTAKMLQGYSTIFSRGALRGYSILAGRFEARCKSSSRTQWIHVDNRTRLSNVWVPTGGIAATENEDAHSKLIRAGFLRQTSSGIFHMLPLGRRVEEKIQDLIDVHMRSLGASRVALSAISSEALWERSGRLSSVASELFRFVDRRGVPFLLSPTHEEEITTLVARSVKSYKQLPLRLFQINRKYRDEFRPRHGLLRGREFIMKDLYTFDSTVQAALETYEQVRAAYGKIFGELKLPILVARASSGSMGGDLSHEYHLPTSLGEDNVVSCSDCDYVVNDELAEGRPVDKREENVRVHVWRGVTRDRTTVVNVWYPETAQNPNGGGHREYTDVDVNLHAVKSLVPDLDSSIDNPLPHWRAAVESSAANSIRQINIIDHRVPLSVLKDIKDQTAGMPLWPDGIDLAHSPTSYAFVDRNGDGGPLNLLRVRAGDSCPRCSSGTLHVQKAIELGHTFHLGTRYSGPLEARVSIPTRLLPRADQADASPSAGTLKQGDMVSVAMQMGCHGIGVTRIIGAVADHLADKKGLNWPRRIAPYEVVIIPAKDLEGDAETLFDTLSAAEKSGSRSLDVILDDRDNSFAWKLNDADLIGYPVIVVLGREWKSNRRCEVQCRRLGVKEHVEVVDLTGFVNSLLDQL
ncbi:hypothetical protein VTK73DRAFT_7648 [Phialemonium thermophilum]|uniref:proline--tRNA ligase n=1 Tax=Phialemonium thermophilum TaxID=223376 RepID=A0ABR3Y7B9_9PEZI